MQNPVGPTVVTSGRDLYGTEAGDAKEGAKGGSGKPPSGASGGLRPGGAVSLRPGGAPAMNLRPTVRQNVRPADSNPLMPDKEPQDAHEQSVVPQGTAKSNDEKKPHAKENGKRAGKHGNARGARNHGSNRDAPSQYVPPADRGVQHQQYIPPSERVPQNSQNPEDTPRVNEVAAQMLGAMLGLGQQPASEQQRPSSQPLVPQPNPQRLPAREHAPPPSSTLPLSGPNPFSGNVSAPNGRPPPEGRQQQQQQPSMTQLQKNQNLQRLRTGGGLGHVQNPGHNNGQPNGVGGPRSNGARISPQQQRQQQRRGSGGDKYADPRGQVVDKYADPRGQYNLHHQRAEDSQNGQVCQQRRDNRDVRTDADRWNEHQKGHQQRHHRRGVEHAGKGGGNNGSGRSVGERGRSQTDPGGDHDGREDGPSGHGHEEWVKLEVRIIELEDAMQSERQSKEIAVRQSGELEAVLAAERALHRQAQERIATLEIALAEERRKVTGVVKHVAGLVGAIYPSLPPLPTVAPGGQGNARQITMNLAYVAVVRAHQVDFILEKLRELLLSGPHSPRDNDASYGAGGGRRLPSNKRTPEQAKRAGAKLLAKYIFRDCSEDSSRQVATMDEGGDEAAPLRFAASEQQPPARMDPLIPGNARVWPELRPHFRALLVKWWGQDYATPQRIQEALDSLLRWCQQGAAAVAQAATRRASAEEGISYTLDKQTGMVTLCCRNSLTDHYRIKRILIQEDSLDRLHQRFTRWASSCVDPAVDVHDLEQFYALVYTMQLRYETLASFDQGSQGACPEEIFKLFREVYGIQHECFASSLNVSAPPDQTFNSLFQDVDQYFGGATVLLSIFSREGCVRSKPTI